MNWENTAGGSIILAPGDCRGCHPCQHGENADSAGGADGPVQKTAVWLRRIPPGRRSQFSQGAVQEVVCGLKLDLAEGRALPYRSENVCLENTESLEPLGRIPCI